jgi:hypothetical protein
MLLLDKETLPLTVKLINLVLVMKNVSMLHKVIQLPQKFQLVLVVVEFINQVKEI